jgi:hypothetical protein
VLFDELPETHALSKPPGLHPKRLRPLVPDDPEDEEPSDTFSVGLSTGRATVTIPKGVTDADLVALVRTILNRKR